ncbi:MAG: T9SS type A sorting domain-containing protein [Chitinophagales bacterium]
MKKVITLLFLTGFIAANAQWANKIVFSLPSTSHAEDSVCYTNPDGSGFDFITNGYWPRVNHQGNRVAFLYGSNATITQNDVYFKDGAGSPYLYYTNGGYDMYNYDFSPEDYYFQFDWQGNFYRMDADQPNGGSTNIGSGAGDFNDVYPRLSTVDSQIVFHNKDHGLYLMPFAGQGNTNLIPNTSAGDMYPYWSPDGQWIYFMTSYDAGNNKMHNIYKIHPNGTNRTQITNLSNADTVGASLVVTKNGKWAVAPARINGITGIYKFRLDQSSLQTTGYLIRAFNYLHSPCNTIWVGSVDSVNNDISMAINEPKELKASIYPNPVTDFVQLQLEKVNGPVKVQLINQLGETLVEENYGPVKTVKLNTNSLPAGIYFIKATADEKAYTTKIIKQ